MTYDRKFGQPEGLADRLDEWAQRLGNDKTLPWVGLGLIDDLKAAVEIVGTVEEHIGPAPRRAPPPPSHAPKMEFDL